MQLINTNYNALIATALPNASLNYDTTQTCKEIKALLRYQPLSGGEVNTLLADTPVKLLTLALNNLVARKEALVTKDFKYTLVEQEQSVEDNSFRELTISVPPGLLKDLRRYAREQGTTAELEASHLLGEIVRLYKAQSVIPTR